LAWQIDNSWVQLVVTCLLSVLMVGLASFFIGINRQERQFVLSLPVVERVLSKFKPKPRI